LPLANQPIIDLSGSGQLNKQIDKNIESDTLSFTEMLLLLIATTVRHLIILWQCFCLTGSFIFQVAPYERPALSKGYLFPQSKSKKFPPSLLSDDTSHA
jgi:hypothetical protein